MVTIKTGIPNILKNETYLTDKGPFHVADAGDIYQGEEEIGSIILYENDKGERFISTVMYPGWENLATEAYAQWHHRMSSNEILDF